MADPDSNSGDSRDDDDEISEAKTRYQVAKEVWHTNHEDGWEDFRFGRLEEQWPENIRRERELDGRPCLTLSILHTLLFQVINDQRQNRPAINIVPVGSEADPDVADVYNGMIRHIVYSSSGEVAIDNGADGAISNGFGFFRINTKYRNDKNFDQDLTLEPIPDHFSVIPDPNINLEPLDWNECWVQGTCSKADWEERWPDKDPVSFDDERPASETSEEEEYLYVERWTRKPVPKTIVALSAIGADQMMAMPDASKQATDLMGNELIVDIDVYEQNQDLFDALGVKVVAKRQVPGFAVKQEFLSGREVLETVEWKGKYIPIVPVWGEEARVKGKRILRSLIRGAKSAQQMHNYWQTTATEQVALAPKAPYTGAKGSFETDAAKWATANIENHAYIEYDPVPGQPPPQRTAPAPIPSGVMAMASSAEQTVMSIVGIFKSSIGAQSNEESGVAINARDSQADTGTYHFKDNLKRALEHAGKVLVDMIPRVYPTRRMVQVMRPDGNVHQQLVNAQGPVMGSNGQPQQTQDPMTKEMVTLEKTLDLSLGDYDIIVKPGPGFATQREQLSQMLVQLIKQAPQLAPILMDIVIKNFDIPDAEEIVERIQQAQQSQQHPELMQAKEALMSAQAQIEALKLQVATLRADKTYDMGKLSIDAFGAETDRLQALAPQGVPLTPEQIAPLVMESMRAIMMNPEMLFAQAPAADPNLAPPAPQPQAQPPMAA